MDLRGEFRAPSHADLYLAPIRPGECFVVALALGISTAVTTPGGSVGESAGACVALGAALLGLLILNSTGFAAMRIPTKDVLRVSLNTSSIQLLVAAMLATGAWWTSLLLACVLELVVLPAIIQHLHTISPDRFRMAQVVSLLTVVVAIGAVSIVVLAIGSIILLNFRVTPREFFR